MDSFLKNKFGQVFLFFLFIFIFLCGLEVFAQVGTVPIEITNPISASTIEEVLRNVARAIWQIVTPLSAIMLIWAGIQYMTAQGEPDKISQAKNSLKYAIIGMIVAIIAGGIEALIIAILG